MTEKEIQELEKASRIQILKDKLKSEDYKILKCYEYSLANKPLPYDTAELNRKRDGIRAEINELEKE